MLYSLCLSFITKPNIYLLFSLRAYGSWVQKFRTKKDEKIHLTFATMYKLVHSNMKVKLN